MAWVEERGIFFWRVIRHAYQRRVRRITRSHANQIKTGWASAPEWLIEECCAVLCVPVSVIYQNGLPEAFRPYEPPQGRHARSSGVPGVPGVSEWSVA